jgi:peptidoglycan/xylan/chitin deacetylase (PgdA/CDA1 family)
MTVGTPSGQGGLLVISLDFELRWGVHDRLGLAGYRDNLLGVRRVVPALLQLFAEFGVRATWATVGMLLLEGKRELLDVLPERRPSYRKPQLSPYGLLREVGESEREDPFHFAPSLARQIAATPGQEIGSHTFGHYYCLEPGQSVAEFRADLEAAVRVTRTKLGVSPRSLVFPRNQVTAPYLEVCRELGFIAYRGNPDAWAYRARREDDESPVQRAVRLADAYLPLTGRNSACLRAEQLPVDVKASRYLRPYASALRPLEALRVRRITGDLRDAAERGRLYHLWWHPHDFGIHLAENLGVLRQVLSCFATLRDRYGMESLTMAEAAERARDLAPSTRQRPGAAA